MKAKIKVALYAICVILLAWIIVSTMEVMLYNGNENYEYSKANLYVVLTSESETTVTVVECVAVDNYYEVTVEDSKGNLWSYYDSEPKTMGTTLRESYAKGEEK